MRYYRIIARQALGVECGQTYAESSLQFASLGAETVEDEVLPDTVIPVTTRRDDGAYKVPALSFTARKVTYDLQRQARENPGKPHETHLLF